MNIKDLSIDEFKEVAELFAVWLKPYTHEVVCRVMEHRHEIINDPATMILLRELKDRTLEEDKEYLHSIGSLLGNYDDYKEYDVHSHPITHAKSYRDVLYDMYIRG